MAYFYEVPCLDRDFIWTGVTETLFSIQIITINTDTHYVKTGMSRRFLLIGSFIGGLISVAIALLMDLLFSDALQGTWRDAITHDLNRYFSLNTTPDSFIVYVVFILILAVLFVIGAFFGSIFTMLIYRFMKFLGSSEE